MEAGTASRRGGLCEADSFSLRGGAVLSSVSKKAGKPGLLHALQ